MDSRLPKFCPGIFVSSVAVFILLSAPTSAEDVTRCYWCGPLADQVHRSQRAPSCDTFDLDQHHTICDKGYTHCAIVATLPPYAESRLCVKFYQDECYSLYCNSTKTWRMVCACRGDLCNGRRSERETEAFAAVPRTLATTRTKRSLISSFNSVKTKAPAENNTIIIINKTNNETINDLQDDRSADANSNISVGDMPKHIEDNIIIEHGTVKNIESSITRVYVSKDETNDENKMLYTPPAMTVTSTKKHVDNAKMAPTTPILEYPTTAEFVKETNGTHVSDATIKPTSIEVEESVVYNSVPPLLLPPAEALQQNFTRTKAVELTSTVVMTTENNQLLETTLSTKINNISKENNGAHNVASLIIFLIIFLIH